MSTDSSPLNTRGYIEALASRGRYQFGSEEAREALGGSEAATKLAVRITTAVKNAARVPCRKSVRHYERR